MVSIIQAEERRRMDLERRAYEERERSWQDEQRRRVEDQRRQQQERFAPAAMTAPPHTADDVRSQISAQVLIGEACIRSVGADERDGEGLR